MAFALPEVLTLLGEEFDAMTLQEEMAAQKAAQQYTSLAPLWQNVGRAAIAGGLLTNAYSILRPTAQNPSGIVMANARANPWAQNADEKQNAVQEEKQAQAQADAAAQRGELFSARGQEYDAKQDLNRARMVMRHLLPVVQRLRSVENGTIGRRTLADEDYVMMGHGIDYALRALGPSITDYRGSLNNTSPVVLASVGNILAVAGRVSQAFTRDHPGQLIGRYPDNADVPAYQRQWRMLNQQLKVASEEIATTMNLAERGYWNGADWEEAFVPFMEPFRPFNQDVPVPSGAGDSLPEAGQYASQPLPSLRALVERMSLVECLQWCSDGTVLILSDLGESVASLRALARQRWEEASFGRSRYPEYQEMLDTLAMEAAQAAIRDVDGGADGGVNPGAAGLPQEENKANEALEALRRNLNADGTPGNPDVANAANNVIRAAENANAMLRQYANDYAVGEPVSKRTRRQMRARIQAAAVRDAVRGAANFFGLGQANPLGVQLLDENAVEMQPAAVEQARAPEDRPAGQVDGEVAGAEGDAQANRVVFHFPPEDKENKIDADHYRELREGIEKEIDDNRLTTKIINYLRKKARNTTEFLRMLQQTIQRAAVSMARGIVDRLRRYRNRIRGRNPDAWDAGLEMGDLRADDYAALGNGEPEDVEPRGSGGGGPPDDDDPFPRRGGGFWRNNRRRARDWLRRYATRDNIGQVLFVAAMGITTLDALVDLFRSAHANMVIIRQLVNDFNTMLKPETAVPATVIAPERPVFNSSRLRNSGMRFSGTPTLQVSQYGPYNAKLPSLTLPEKAYANYRRSDPDHTRSLDDAAMTAALAAARAFPKDQGVAPGTIMRVSAALDNKRDSSILLYDPYAELPAIRIGSWNNAVAYGTKVPILENVPGDLPATISNQESSNVRMLRETNERHKQYVDIVQSLLQ